jgi:GNAT superfamily N-acetyltransferase
MLRDAEESLAAVAALKRPLLSYRRRVFASSRSALDPIAYNLELGYVAVSPAFARRGLSHKIVTALLAVASGENIFATTRADQPAMNRTLPAAGFRRAGIEYLSRHGMYPLVLYTRPGRTG